MISQYDHFCPRPDTPLYQQLFAYLALGADLAQTYGFHDWEVADAQR